MKYLFALLIFAMPLTISAQTPPIEPGVSQELAKWRAARYSDVRYKLNLTLEKMSPVLKGTIEIRVKVGARTPSSASPPSGDIPPIILDWRKIKGHEDKSTVSNVSVNGKPVKVTTSPPADAGGSDFNEHLVFRDGVVAGENVIKLDFTSPILTSGSAITRYVDKEDGAEYIYSLFVPSDASTAFPVFDQPDLKGRFSLQVDALPQWKVISNSPIANESEFRTRSALENNFTSTVMTRIMFAETKPISTYVFTFAAGPFVEYRIKNDVQGSSSIVWHSDRRELPGHIPLSSSVPDNFRVFARGSQFGKFNSHAAEVFRLNREAIKYFEQYFDYKFPFPKYDLVLIPEFPFGGMEHAGATFLREASIIFPQEPTKNDHISRATLIFHEAAHQWFGDTVTMRWFDDLWLKEGFATFTAYKAMEKIMPEMNAWKVFYERVKQAAYQTDSTKGTTPIYQEIKNLSAAKSAYGNIVYNKAPAFLRQAEFYLGEDKFQTAVRAFLMKHEFKNAGWEDLVREFEEVKVTEIVNSDYYRQLSSLDKGEFEKFTRWSIGQEWAEFWVEKRGTAIYRISSRVLENSGGMAFFLNFGATGGHTMFYEGFSQTALTKDENYNWLQNVKVLKVYDNGYREEGTAKIGARKYARLPDQESKPREKFEFEPQTEESRRRYEEERRKQETRKPLYTFPNYQDYGYGIFLLDDKSRDYVLKNIQNEKDPFLRTMMWGSLWDSVREGELDPREYVELVLKVQGAGKDASERDKSRTLSQEDESTIATLLGRTGTALNYYIESGVSSPHVSKGSSRPTNNAANEEKSASLSDGRAPDGQRRALTNMRATDTGDLRTRLENLLIDRMRNAETVGQRITYYRAFLNLAASENARMVLKKMLATGGNPSGSEGAPGNRSGATQGTLPTGRVSASAAIPLKTKDKFDIVTRLLILSDPDAPRLLAGLEKTETSDEAKRYAYAAKAGIATAENKAKYWNDFVNNKEISESWIEAAFGPFNSIRHSDLTLPYLQKALQELPNHKRSRKIFFVNGWLGAFIGGQRSEGALGIVNKFLTDNPDLDKDLRLKILENVDLIERAVRIRK